MDPKEIKHPPPASKRVHKYGAESPDAVWEQISSKEIYNDDEWLRTEKDNDSKAFLPNTPEMDHNSWLYKPLSSGKDLEKMFHPFNQKQLLRLRKDKVPDKDVKDYALMFGPNYDPYPIKDEWLRSIQKHFGVSLDQKLTPEQSQVFMAAHDARERERNIKERERAMKKTVFDSLPPVGSTLRWKWDTRQKMVDRLHTCASIGFGAGFSMAFIRALSLYGYGANMRGRGRKVMVKTLFSPTMWAVGLLTTPVMFTYQTVRTISQVEKEEIRSMVERKQGWKLRHIFFRETSLEDWYAEDYRGAIIPHEAMDEVWQNEIEEFDPEDDEYEQMQGWQYPEGALELERLPQGKIFTKPHPERIAPDDAPYPRKMFKFNQDPSKGENIW